MRILLICTNSDEAGAPIHVFNIITALRGEFTFKVVFGSDGPIARRCREEGADVVVVPGLRSDFSAVDDLRVLRALCKIAMDFAPHVIHAHSSKAGLHARLMMALERVPVVFTVHGWGWRGLSRRGAALVIGIERLLSAWLASKYIYVSRSVETEGKSALGLTAVRGVVIHNGVPDFFKTEAPRGCLRILMAARVNHAKDHETLVRAFELLPSTATLTMCGTGTDSAEFVSAVRSWAPRAFGRVSCLGSRSDMRELLAGANVFALVSHFEALPLSVIEAMSAGRAIVATDVGGLRELVDNGQEGILVKPRDVNALAEALVVLDDDEVRRRFSERARARYIERFSLAQMASSLAEVYRRLRREYSEDLVL